MGYWFHYAYIDDQECPTLAKQKAKEEAILAEIRQVQAERESARPERTEASRPGYSKRLCPCLLSGKIAFSLDYFK